MNASGFDKSQILSTTNSVNFSESQKYLSYTPVIDSIDTSILFFPGALVQPEAYAPLAQKLANSGYTVYIQKIPFRITLTQKMEDKALDEAHEFISNSGHTNWIVAGHSRGGRMAVNFSIKYPNQINKVILLGTSHPREKDLSETNLRFLKISATEDRLASPNEIKQFSKNLPSDTKFVMIDGANHSQFGYYGFQLGAGKALISREKQQQKTISEIITFLKN